MESAIFKRLQHGEQNRIGLFVPAQLVQGLDGEVGKAGGGAAVFVNLESVGAIGFRSAAPLLPGFEIIVLPNGNQVSRQAVFEAGITHVFHFGEQAVHDLVRLVAGDEPVSDRHAVHK